MYSKGLGERAIREYLTAIDLDIYSWLVYYRLGTAYRAEERLEGALESYEQAIKIRPDDETARVGIGKVYEAQGEWEKAIAVYQQAIEVDPDSATPYVFLGTYIVTWERLRRLFNRDMLSGRWSG